MNLIIHKTCKDDEGKTCYEVTLFDNTPSGKDSKCKLKTSLDLVFSRFVRNGGVMVGNVGLHCRHQDLTTAPIICRFKRVRIWSKSGADGKQGSVTAIMEPIDFFPTNNNRDYSLLRVVENDQLVRVLGVGVRHTAPVYHV